MELTNVPHRSGMPPVDGATIWARIVYAPRSAWMARAFRADLALIDSGSAHYFALAVFRLVGVPIAVNMHNVRWPPRL